MKIIIIGAGPAGITAAYELAKKNRRYEITIFEASDRIGGISQTVNYKGNCMDMGGHRFFSKSKRVIDWWYEILRPQGKPAIDDKMLGREMSYDEIGADPEISNDVMLNRHRISRIYYKNKFFDYPVTMKPETIKNMGLITTFGVGISYLFACIHKLPENSLENFYINRFGKKLYEMFFEDYTKKVWGRHPSLISADWGTQRIKGLSVRSVFKDIISKMTSDSKKVETSLIEEFYYPKFGSGQLWKTALDKSTKMDVKLKMNCRVTGINVCNGNVTGIIYSDNGIEKYTDADIVISSMPINETVQALNTNVPDNISYAAEKLPYRDFITVGLLISRLKLENKTNIPTFNGLIPDCWIYVQDNNVKLGRIQIFNNWSPYMINDFKNTVWLGLEYFCNDGDDMWNMSDKKFVDFAASELEGIGVIDKNDILDTHIERVKKAYPAYFGTYEKIDEIKEYLNSFNNLFCIGRNGQHRYNNMDHSMLTAFETVDEIERSKDGFYYKERIWNVNTESSYHEEKINIIKNNSIYFI